MTIELASEKLRSLEGRAKQLLGEFKQRLDSSRQLVDDARQAAVAARDAADRAQTAAEAIRDLASQFRLEVDDFKDAVAAVRAAYAQSIQSSELSVASQELRRKWAIPVSQPLVLISQVERAGGTLLLRLFDGHPACFVHPHELKWGESKFCWPRLDALTHGHDEVDTTFDRLQEEWPAKFIARGGYYKWSTDAHPELLPFVFDESLQRAIFRDMYATRQAGSRRDVFNAFLTSVFNAWLDYQNLYAAPKKVVTAFLPRLLMDDPEADRFFDDYPDGHLLTLVRHPGAWMASTRKFRGEAFEMQDWHRSVTASVDAHARRPDRVTVIVFEDLVLRTEAVMRSLCGRIGIHFDPVLLAPTFNGMPALSDSSFTSVIGIDPQVTRRYEEILTSEQIAQVEETCMPTYREIAREFSAILRV